MWSWMVHQNNYCKEIGRQLFYLLCQDTAACTGLTHDSQVPGQNADYGQVTWWTIVTKQVFFCNHFYEAC